MNYLLSRLQFGFSPGLQTITDLCESLGNPQKKFKSIHVVGTNGKGSAAFYIANILQAHNLKTALFTSPHLVSVRERFCINGKFISQQELDDLLFRVEKAAVTSDFGGKELQPSYFETLTAAAFLWFAEQNVDVAVLEAGLGGRFDSTKIAEGKIVALTSIGLDHTEILGDTKEKILQEKLGIVSDGAVLVSNAAALPSNVIENAPFNIANVSPQSPALQVGNYGKVYEQNAELAYATAKLFIERCVSSLPRIAFSDSAARSALANSVWAGRMQFLHSPFIADKTNSTLQSGNKQSQIDFILDGAHNPQAAFALAECLLEKHLPPLPCIFASLTDKDTKSVLEILKPRIAICYCAQIDNPRARKPEEVAEICEQLGIKAKIIALPSLSKISAKAFANEEKQPKLPTLITGSLYLVGMAIKELAQQYPELAEFRDLEIFPNEQFSTLPAK